MKRTPLKRKTRLKAKRGLKTKSGLKKRGKSTVSKIKNRIQALLRARAIERDGECVVGQYRNLLPATYYYCGPLRTDGEIIVQAEHLVGRSNSASYADMDNIILLCMRHHFYFKKQHGALYWSIVQTHIGPERWEKVKTWEADRSPHRMRAADWAVKERELTNHKE